MPNTMAHFGVQGFLSRMLFRRIDLRWVLLGCTLPDVAWIGQRLVNAVAPRADPYFVRLYAVSQATLLCSTILAGACAAIARRPRPVFLLLSFNVLLHLLLDACQTKWGNGVHLFAPLSWRMENFGYFWPESWFSHLLTLLGVVFVAWVWRRGLWAPLRLDWRRWPLAVFLLCLYLLLPAWLQSGAYRHNVHDARTLREERVGEAVGLDRGGLEQRRLRVWNRRSYRLEGETPSGDTVLSMRGVLVAPGTMRVDAYHDHRGSHRDFASMAGLALLAAAFGIGVARSLKPRGRGAIQEP